MNEIPHGYCHCGCGEKTVIADRTSTRDHTIKGQPKTFLHGHAHSRNRFGFGTIEEILIDDAPCLSITLRAGLKAFFDIEDLSLVQQYRWGYSGAGYAQGFSMEMTPRRITMHALIAGHLGSEIDHRNRNRMDYRRCNLRAATRSQNNINRDPPPRNKSGYTGVFFHKNCKRNPWAAYITKDGTRINGGRFKTREAAARRRDELAVQCFGEFAVTRF